MAKYGNVPLNKLVKATKYYDRPTYPETTYWSYFGRSASDDSAVQVDEEPSATR